MIPTNRRMARRTCDRTLGAAFADGEAKTSAASFGLHLIAADATKWHHARRNSTILNPTTERKYHVQENQRRPHDGCQESRREIQGWQGPDQEPPGGP